MTQPVDGDALRAGLRRDMTGAMREALGAGYTRSYYEQMAADFVLVGEGYLDVALAEVERLCARLYEREQP